VRYMINNTEICVLYAYICVDGFMARGVPRILKFVTVSEILLKILSPLTSLGVYSSCASIFPWLPRGESFLGNLWVISRFNDLVL